MKIVFLLALANLACLEPMPEYIAAPDPEPEVCDGENYPFETPPDTCESDSFGTCCSWTIDSPDGGVCRYDYCTYHESQCEWTFMLKDCS